MMVDPSAYMKISAVRSSAESLEPEGMNQDEGTVFDL